MYIILAHKIEAPDITSSALTHVWIRSFHKDEERIAFLYILKHIHILTTFAVHTYMKHLYLKHLQSSKVHIEVHLISLLITFMLLFSMIYIVIRLNIESSIDFGSSLSIFFLLKSDTLISIKPIIKLEYDLLWFIVIRNLKSCKLNLWTACYKTNSH